MRLNSDDGADGAEDLPDDPDDESPLGDGTVDTDALVVCPYCAEAVDIAIDPAGGSDQRYEEDCEVCCQPWEVHVTYGHDGHAEVSITPLDA